MGIVREDAPLKGYVILDFTWLVAGPAGSRQWADWGAEVYRIEWPENPDMMRMVGLRGNSSTEEFYEASGTLFSSMSASKTGITLNMKSEEGRALFRELLLKADAVVENFSPQAMEKWGFDYETMRAINPRIIYMSVCGYGHTGPQKYYLTYGPSAQALSGLTHASGLPGEEPAGWGFSYMDHTAGYVNGIALLMALYGREFSGEGQYLDLSQPEAAMNLTGAAFLDFSVNGRSSRREGFPPGNRATWPGYPVTNAYRAEPTTAPHNAYRTKPSARTEGDPDNDWAVITCFTEEQWQALAEAMGRADLVGDPRFATLDARLGNQTELDAIIEGWTSQRDKFEVMETLQALRIPAGAVQSSRDRVETDPQLAERQIYKRLPGAHPFFGDKLFESTPVSMSETPPKIYNRAPLIGEHNEEAYERLMGFSAEKVRELVSNGTLWPKGLPRPRWVKGSEAVDAELRLAGE